MRLTHFELIIHDLPFAQFKWVVGLFLRGILLGKIYLETNTQTPFESGMFIYKTRDPLALTNFIQTTVEYSSM